MLRKFGLRFNHLIDAFFKCAFADHFVNIYSAVLADAERAIGCLILDSGIPPTVVMEDVIGSGEVETNATSLERQHKDRARRIVRLEAFDELLTLGLRRSAVKKQRFSVKFLPQHCNEQMSHLTILREDQRTITVGDNLFNHLHDARGFARARRKCFARAKRWQRN